MNTYPTHLQYLSSDLLPTPRIPGARRVDINLVPPSDEFPAHVIDNLYDATSLVTGGGWEYRANLKYSHGKQSGKNGRGVVF